MDGQCGKLVTVVGQQFITLTVDICVQYGGREALRCAGLSSAAETGLQLIVGCENRVAILCCKLSSCPRGIIHVCSRKISYYAFLYQTAVAEQDEKRLVAIQSQSVYRWFSGLTSTEWVEAVVGRHYVELSF